MIKYIFISSLLYVSLFYNAAFDTNKMTFYSVHEVFGSSYIYFILLILMALIAMLKISQLNLTTVDLLFIVFTLLFITVTLKNYILTNSSHLRTTLFFPYFYFIGRMIFYLKNTTPGM